MKIILRMAVQSEDRRMKCIIDLISRKEWEVDS
jgi:hypothetical protein